MTGDYRDFLRRKSQVGSACGFEPEFMPDYLKPFQRSLVEWDIRKGRAGNFADCGLGKTVMAYVVADNCVRKTHKPAIMLAPLAVADQTVREGKKFGITAQRSKDGKFASDARIVVTNYDRLRLFNPDDFCMVACDESGCIKDDEAKRTAEVTEFLRTISYRQLYTATAAPNDYIELGTSAEALGEMGFQDMLSRFFKQQTSKDHLGWGRTKYYIRPHAEPDFWRWVCSWSRACRKPSDLGFEDDEFILPPLTTEEHVIESRTRRSGTLFDLPAVTLEEQREERRRTLGERCEKTASLVADTGRPAVCWCDLNDEGDYLTRLIPGAVQVSGKDHDDAKEEKFLDFASGEIRVLVTKPVIAGFGLNWQHCAHEVFFPTHSFERYYQSVRRCWRFGQTSPVKVDVVASEGERGVLENLNRKAGQAERMFEMLVNLMNDHLNIQRSNPFRKQSQIPAWLAS